MRKTIIGAVLAFLVVAITVIPASAASEIAKVQDRGALPWTIVGLGMIALAGLVVLAASRYKETKR